MTIIDDYTAAYYSRNNFVDSANFQTSLSSKESKTLNFFEQLYSSPQKLTLKWPGISYIFLALKHFSEAHQQNIRKSSNAML